eukprot:1912645-Rhodomonas_salina.1
MQPCCHDIVRGSICARRVKRRCVNQSVLQLRRWRKRRRGRAHLFGEEDSNRFDVLYILLQARVAAISASSVASLSGKAMSVSAAHSTARRHDTEVVRSKHG